jgi:hypothetical protein
MNCEVALLPKDAMFFMGVFVCPSCHQTATRLYVWRLRQIEYLKTAAKEEIRLMLIEKKLHLGPLELKDDRPENPQLLRPLPQLVEERHAARARASHSDSQGQSQAQTGDDSEVGNSGGSGVGR